jgi:hypothetical protein
MFEVTTITVMAMTPGRRKRMGMTVLARLRKLGPAGLAVNGTGAGYTGPARLST